MKTSDSNKGIKTRAQEREEAKRFMKEQALKSNMNLKAKRLVKETAKARSSEDSSEEIKIIEKSADCQNKIMSNNSNRRSSRRNIKKDTSEQLDVSKPQKLFDDNLKHSKSAANWWLQAQKSKRQLKAQYKSNWVQVENEKHMMQKAIEESLQHNNEFINKTGKNVILCFLNC